MPRQDIDFSERLKSTKNVTLTVTRNCNLRCLYCYEPTAQGPRFMSFETAKTAILEYMGAADGFEGVEFDFFGGEPMLAFPLIKETVEWFHTREWTKAHRFFVCTNGTILTDAMRAWLKERKNCIHVGVSLDGTEKAHNINRDGSYRRVSANLPFFLEHWPNQPLKMTISAQTIPFLAESIIDLEERDYLFTANIPFEDIWGTDQEKEALLNEYERQLDILVSYYAARPSLFPVRPILDRKIDFVSRPEWCRRPPTDSSDTVAPGTRWSWSTSTAANTAVTASRLG